MTKKKKSILSDQRFIVLLVIIVLCAIFSGLSKEFRQYTTILSMLDFSYYDLLMAIGVTFPLITGGVDLSIGTGMVAYALIGGTLIRNNNCPVALAMLICIVLGIAVGAAAGYALSRFFEAAFARNHMVRGSVKVIIVLSVSFLLVALETVLKGKIALSGLLAVTSMACMLARKTTGEVRARLSEKFGKLWIAAELILFVLVGAAVDIRYVSETGLAAVLMVFAALIFRAAGVVLCLAGTKLSRRERLFCVIAYLPKATVQAAIGSVPLAMGLPCGKIVLSVAVLAILITAPLGALGMDAAYRKLLKYEG